MTRDETPRTLVEATRTRVLLVDDDDDTVALLGLLLERKGFDVAVARSVKEAAAKLGSSSFDAVVTDHHLDDGDARDVLAVAGRARQVVLSGATDVPVGPPAVFLRKPVDVPRLLAALRGEGAGDA